MRLKMKLEKRTDITAFYDLANCCNYDIDFVAFLLYLLRYKPTVKVISDLEKLKVSHFENEFNILLDNLQINTIRNLYSIYQINQKATDEKINTASI